MATKLEAFADRGNDDCIASRDFEDIILLVDFAKSFRKSSPARQASCAPT